MPRTKCYVAGQPYYLDYNRKSVKEGVEYVGTFHTKDVFTFRYIVFDDLSAAFFEPLDQPKYRQDAIIKAIEEDEPEQSDAEFIVQ